MKKLLLALTFISVMTSAYGCTDPRCAYERMHPRQSHLINHFDVYGKLLGTTFKESAYVQHAR